VGLLIRGGKEGNEATSKGAGRERRRIGETGKHGKGIIPHKNRTKYCITDLHVSINKTRCG